MIIKKIIYQLEKDGEWKEGLSIEGNLNSCVIDKDGNLLNKDENGYTVYNAQDVPNDLCINLKTIIK